MKMIGECWNCEDHTLVWSEDNNFINRSYCNNCVSTCVFCSKVCDYYGCKNDEGEQDFENYHRCYVDGKITCLETNKLCKYRYCLTCTEKCSECNFNIVLRGNICKHCLPSDKNDN